MEAVIGIVGAIIALVAAIIAYYQAQVARQSVQQAARLKLFSTFELANQALLSNPELLYSVHGLDKSISSTEATSIAYLSLILDGYQHYYGEQFNENFSEMTNKLKITSTFLNRILAVPENQKRWVYLKNANYDEFDKQFIKAIDELISHENSQRKSVKSNLEKK